MLIESDGHNFSPSSISCPVTGPKPNPSKLVQKRTPPHPNHNIEIAACCNPLHPFAPSHCVNFAEVSLTCLTFVAVSRQIQPISAFTSLYSLCTDLYSVQSVQSMSICLQAF